MRGKVDSFGISDIGRQRESNQDQFLIADLRKSIVIHHSSLGYDDQTELAGASRAKLLMVADGMGGHTGGERASWLAVEGVVRYFLTNLHWPINCERDHEPEFFRGMHAALNYSRDKIRSAAEACPDQGRMGTTLTLAWIVWPHAYLIHVGDSRAYRFRDGDLELLSHDQTLAQALADEGLLNEQELKDHQFSNVLTSSLGCNPDMEPFYSRVELEIDDKLLICSDGLTKHLPNEQIATLLARDVPAEATCRNMVDQANEAGGLDNITVVLAKFMNQPDEQQHNKHARCDIEAGHETAKCLPAQNN